jgi:hypothetical protein
MGPGRIGAMEFDGIRTEPNSIIMEISTHQMPGELDSCANIASIRTGMARCAPHTLGANWKRSARMKASLMVDGFTGRVRSGRPARSHQSNARNDISNFGPGNGDR